jgi:hypothetical protein
MAEVANSECMMLVTNLQTDLALADDREDAMARQGIERYARCQDRLARAQGPLLSVTTTRRYQSA